jgi:hypothetical protein
MVERNDRKIREQLSADLPRAHLFATPSQTNLDLSPARMQILWGRFHKVIKGFTDFQHPGDLADSETATNGRS